MSKMEKLNDTTTTSCTKRTRTTKIKKDLDSIDNLIKQEAIECQSIGLNKQELTRIDLIDDISIYAFYDIETLRNYVSLNHLVSYQNPNASTGKSSRPSKSSKRNESKRRKEETNDDDLYDCNYLKKLDDNLMNEDFSNSELSDHFEDSFNEDTKSMIWQPTIEKQKKHNLTHKKQRNISITSSSIRSYSRTDSSTGSLSPDHSLPECGKAHCKLGCICDAISASLHDNSSCSPTPFKQNKFNVKNDESENSNHHRDHCGRFECMFECNCSRRLRSSTRKLNRTEYNHKKDEEMIKPSKQFKKETKLNENNKTNKKDKKYLNSTKSKLSQLKYNSSKTNSGNKKQVENSKTATQLRQSKRVKLLKKKNSPNSKETSMQKNSTPSSFKDFYFYYHCDNKLSSLNSRKKKRKESDDELDVNFENQEEDDVENYADVDEEEHKDDTDFVLEKVKKTSKKNNKKLLESNNTDNNNNNKIAIKSIPFEPYTQNITLKIQSKSLLYSSAYVSIPLKIEVFTSKWDTMANLNKRVLRLLAKLLQKLDVVNESKKTFRELEFEFDKEIICIVFAASHLKDCSNDDLIKPINVKISEFTKENSNSKVLISKTRLKSLLADDENKLFSLVFKNEDKLSNNHSNLIKPLPLEHLSHIRLVNNENSNKPPGFVNKSLPRLILRNRLPHHKQQNVKPTQTSLIFKNVEFLFEKMKSQLNNAIMLKSKDNLSNISSNLLNFRPSFIDKNLQRDQNDSFYIFRDEIEYAEKFQFSEYKFYNPFSDESLVLDLYKRCESRDLVDSVCTTVNDMIKVVSLYSENLIIKQETNNLVKSETDSNATTTVKLTKITDNNMSTSNKTNFIIINQKPKQDELNRTDNNNSDLGLQRKIILPSTSINFKTLVKIVSSNKDDETKASTNNPTKIKISSSLIPATKPTFPNIIKTSTIQQQPITKIITPVSSNSSSSRIITSVTKGLSPPKIITMPFNKSNNITQPKILSIANSSLTTITTSNKSFIPIRPKTSPLNESLVKPSTLTGLIMTDDNNNNITNSETDLLNDGYIESRKRKRKQDLSSLAIPSVKSTIVSLKASSSNDDHLNILNKQINSIKNEFVESSLVKKNNNHNISSVSSPFKISTSLFKHHATTSRAISVESTNDLNESIKSMSDSSEPSMSKKSKILVSKENDSEEEILESDNSDSDNECKKSTTSSTLNSTSTTNLKKRKTSSRYDNDSSNSSFDDDDDYEDDFEKKMTKKLLSTSINSNSNKPIVNNIHSIRERQRRFRLKKLLIKLKIVLYECESNSKFDMENTESKLKLDEYFSQKNFKMKSKQNILQEAVLLIRDLQIQEKRLQTLVSIELKRNEELKFHLRELI